MTFLVCTYQDVASHTLFFQKFELLLCYSAVTFERNLPSSSFCQVFCYSPSPPVSVREENELVVHHRSPAAYIHTCIYTYMYIMYMYNRIYNQLWTLSSKALPTVNAEGKAQNEQRHLQRTYLYSSTVHAHAAATNEIVSSIYWN